MTEVEIPGQQVLAHPTLEALKRLGGAARIQEIVATVVEREAFTDEQLAVRRNNDDAMSKIEYHLAWARNDLKLIGAIENSSRGVWAITEVGRRLSPEQTLEAIKTWRADYNRDYQQRKREDAENDEGSDQGTVVTIDEESAWKAPLIERLLQMSPEGFERLAQRLLLEAGFRNVEVTGQTGDSGLDGVGVLRISLISFPVYFQCKRHKNSVGPGDVRDFRGAMAGRGEKGLLISTASFTRAAIAEASRDGAPLVELVNGNDLCDLLQEYELGVTTRSQTIEVVELRLEYFDEVEAPNS